MTCSLCAFSFQLQQIDLLPAVPIAHSLAHGLSPGCRRGTLHDSYEEGPLFESRFTADFSTNKLKYTLLVDSALLE